MYNIYVCKVKNIRPAPNADRLNLCEVFGNTTVVDKSINDKDLYLYLPTDGRISIEFGTTNDLFRRKDADGNPAGGFIDPDKRNIRAISIRGNRSDGLVLPLATLSPFGDISNLKEGDIVSTFNGHIIAEKYIPAVRHTSSSTSGKGSKTHKRTDPIAPLFKEHIDTAQLAYNLDAFHNGDLIEITRKLHGCFIAGTKVRMANGSLKEIQRIRVGEEVLGYNFNTKKIEATKVLHTFKNAPSSKWNRLKFSREGTRGDKRGTQTSTYNHRYWVEEENKWVMAQDLKVGQTISTLVPSPVLTSLQKEICIGQILGDGCLLTYNNRTADIEEGKKEEHRGYLEYISKISSNFFYISSYKRTSEYGTKMVSGKTHRSADLYNYLKNYSTFKNGANDIRLKPEIVNVVSPLSLAIWYMGDGSLAHNEFQQDRANFAICRYTQPEDRETIKNIFLKFNIIPSFYQDSRRYWRIRLNKDEATKLFELIASYIPPIMSYKLSESYRNKFNPPAETEIYNPNGYVLSPQIVLENTPIEKEYDEYDLETELHNYVVGLTIVHNTSQRTAYLPVLKEYKRSIWDRLFRRPGQPVYDYDYITGTRRTLLNSWDGGFYGNDSFRKHAHDAFVGKLQQGESIYLEVIGFTDDGRPIMGSGAVPKEYQNQYGKTMTFAYGCDPTGKSAPKNDFYVYRMTYTTPDGFTIEYSPSFMRYRCEQMGVKTVPVEWKGFIPDDVNPGEWIQKKAEEFYDGPEPIDPRQVREGVVVRILNKPTFTAFKIKNYLFKCISGIISEKTQEAMTQDIAEEL